MIGWFTEFLSKGFLGSGVQCDFCAPAMCSCPPHNEIVNNITSGFIKKSSVHGFGLFSNRSFRVGAEVGYLDGQIVESYLHFRYRKFPEWNALDGGRLLVRLYRTKYSFINHSITPNLRTLPDKGLIVATCNIAPGDEFLLDYTSEPLPDEYISRKGDFLGYL